jgi:hypothetical protein
VPSVLVLAGQGVHWVLLACVMGTVLVEKVS